MLIREKYVSLHPLKRNNGRVAQLNRVADYGSAGYRFESCRDHLILCILCGGFYFFPHFIEEIGAQSENLGDCVFHSAILYPGSILEKKHVVGYFFIELIYKTNMFH